MGEIRIFTCFLTIHSEPLQLRAQIQAYEQPPYPLSGFRVSISFFFVPQDQPQIVVTVNRRCPPPLGFWHPHIHCTRPFRPSLHVELYAISLFQTIKIRPLQSGAVEEDFSSIFCTYEPVSPSPEEFLYLSFQAYHLLSVEPRQSRFSPFHSRLGPSLVPETRSP